jgi:acyl dehydratase
MRYFEDFAEGQTFDLGTTTVDEAEMIAFARRFDPQPFHTDPAAARTSPFGELIASGWFTGSLFMRLYYDGLLKDAASHGSPGAEELSWLAPVRAGDELRGRITVLSVRPSAKRADRGSAVLEGELLRGDAPVLRMRFRALLGRRPATPD